MKALRPVSRTSRGFTAAEMLVGTMIAAMVTGMAALVAYSVTNAQHQYENIASVDLPAGALANFYGGSGTNITTAVAPNFSSVAHAEEMRGKFIADVAEAVAVYPLSRASGTYNVIRPTSITSPPAGTLLDTQDAFRAYLTTLYGASNFTSYRNHPGTRSCLSIYVLGFSGNATTIPVIAIYDLDVVTAQIAGANMGTYVSMRRYVGATLTNYYDIIYPDSGDGTDSWYPPVVNFERQSRKSVVEGSTTYDRFKIAEEKPFFLMFWPDPARSSLRLPSGNTTSSLNPGLAATDPRQAYNHMAGRTSYMMAVPMFPSS